MAKFWMINMAMVGTTKFLPGDEVDDTNDPYAAIVAAGGFLYPQGDATIDAAAAVALTAKKSRGANEVELGFIMTSAVDAVQKAAEAALSAATQKGTTTLVAGVSPAIVATITATSRIGFALKNPANGALTVKFAALDADRVVGAPGSFKVTALVAAGTINVADTSDMDWWVFN